MKIGYIQLSPVLGDLDATLRRVDDSIGRCHRADLLVLPELCNSGYNFRDFEEARKGSEEMEKSVFLHYLESKCRDLGLYVVSGFNEREGDCLYNSAVLVGPKGFLGKYRKLHLFMKEKDYFRPGDAGLPIFDIGLCRLGMLVCFDWIFPEVWRILALKGAEIICHPSNLVLPGLAQSAVPIHALVNRVFVVTANRIGTEGDLTFTGLSTICDPQGTVLLQASKDHKETGILEIDPARAREKRITARNDIFEDRRPALYGLLSEPFAAPSSKPVSP